MALAQVLSALRNIILDEYQLPHTYQERLAQLRQYFPALTEAELEDLAKISPQQFQIYTGTIFRGEAALLRRLFPMTFAYLTAGWPLCYGKQLNALTLIKQLHQSRPWNGSATVDLTKQFIAFVQDDLPLLTAKFVELPEVAELEQLTLLISRAPDDPRVPILASSDLGAYSVSELLELQFTVPSGVRFAVFDYDVLSLRTMFLANKPLPPSTATTNNKIFASGSRSADFSVYWSKLAEHAFSFLSSLPRLEPSTIGELAGEFAEDISESLSEEEMFRRFFSFLVRCMEEGLIIVIPTQ